jgi:hypothetical protein
VALFTLVAALGFYVPRQAATVLWFSTRIVTILRPPLGSVTGLLCPVLHPLRLSLLGTLKTSTFVGKQLPSAAVESDNREKVERMSRKYSS